MASNWWVRGAFEDVKRIGLEGLGGLEWRFPFGTNEYDSLWAFTWGKARFALGDAETEIVAIGAPMSAVPYRSRLWSEAGANGSRFVTWENFVLGRASAADYQLPSTNYQLVSAQIELRSTGDFIVRSNEVETVYRRVDPEDWDGDGWRNDDDYDPYSWDDCSGDFYQDLPYGADTNAYCWIEVRPEWNTWIYFQGDGDSNLPDPLFTAEAGRTYRVWMLIGKTYSVFAPMPVSVVGWSDDRMEISDITENSFTAVWPVTFTVAEGRAPTGRPRLGATWNDGGKSFYVMPNPSWLRGAVTWTDNYCCDVWGDGTNFTYACDNSCTCEGCTVYGSYWYEGYGLPVWGISCGCHYVEDHGPTEMSLTFDKSAAIYEDDYTNRPGVVVHPTPSNVVLRCQVYGGTYGGRLTVTLNEAGHRKIARVSGNALPNNVLIQPDTTRVFETVYTPLEPSDRANDIVAVATFVEDFTHDEYEPQTATLTSVKVELEAVNEASENPDKHRHWFGIGEDVKYRSYPDITEVEWVFSDAIVSRGDGMFMCPWATNNLCEGGCFSPRVLLGSGTYVMRCKAFQPEIAPRNPCININPLHVNPVLGEAGHLLLYLDMYVAPFYVSFEGLCIREIIDESQSCPHGGYYNDQSKGGSWSHTQAAGAGAWNDVDASGYYATDRAGVAGGYSEPWTDGYKEWDIPMDWGVHSMSMGRFIPDPTTQRYELTSDGTFTIRKFHFNALRTAYGETTIWHD